MGELKKKKVMVVEGDEDLHDILEDLLQKQGYEYQKMISGQELYQLLEDQKGQVVNLFIVDLSLPDMRARDVKNRIREHFGANVPILSLVRWSAKRDISEELEESEPYLTLPFRPQKLLRKVEELT